MLKEHITKNYLQECFIYDKNKGILIWKSRPLHHFKNKSGMDWFNRRFANKQAGFIHIGHRSNTKYKAVKINGITFKLHQAVWIYHNDTYKNNFNIDHIDNNGLNNKIENLRLVTQSINLKNRPLQKTNKTGINGVNWHKSANKWQVRIKDNNGNRLDLGRYDNFNEAVKIRKDAEKLYGYLQ